MSKLDKRDSLKYPDMKALIVYQDFTSAAKANNALQHSSQHSDVQVQWNIRPWRVDMLRFPPTAADALVDATDAHLIVLAGCCSRSISYYLLNWLESWANCRQIEGAALAIFGREKGDELSASAVLEFSQFIKRHGLSVIFDNRRLIDDSLMNADSSQQLKHPGPSTFPQISDIKPRSEDWFRQWGINE